MEEVMFSIVSVCFNCEDDVMPTINSLKHQSYENYEYIVVDGGSTDNTLEIIKNITYDMKNVKILSESDKGIYDAMNKAIGMCSGKYVYFLNMGDRLYASNTLEKVSIELDKDVDVFYGDIDRSGKIISQKNKGNLFYAIYREYMICHQSIFASKSVLVNNNFNIKYPICADRDWFIRVLRKNYHITYADIIIATYDESGISSNYEKFELESLKLTREQGILPFLFIIIKRWIGKIKQLYCGYNGVSANYLK